MATQVRGILLDIEGTTSCIAFVMDVMFPLARKELRGVLDQHFDRADVVAARQQMEIDAKRPLTTAEEVALEAYRLMDSDVKATGLKQLQGIVWDDAFVRGELVAHLYDDVPVALRTWNAAGLDVRIYSSGSIQAQKKFFGYSVAGDLLPLLKGHYDTTTGGKKEAASYTKIAEAMQLSPSEILFVSDVVAELDAARAAGMQTRLSMRPGNPVQPENDHLQITSFDQIQV